MLGEIEGRMRRGLKGMRRLIGITDATNMNLGETPGDGEGQGGLACCSSWGHKVRGVTRLDMTSQLNNN